MFTARKLAATLLLAFISISATAQQVDGHWFGVGMLQSSLTYQHYMSELVLRQKGKNVSGVLNYYFRDSLVSVKINGSFDEYSRRVSIKPFPMIYYQSPSARNSIDCYMSGSFLLVASKAESVLNGMLYADADHKYTAPNISFKLKRSADTLDWVKADEPVVVHDTVAVIQPDIPQPVQTETAAEFAKREKVFSQEIDVENSSIKIELYDNGQIDYDSVSLFFNNKRILPKTKLDHRAIRLTIDLDPSLPDNELSMFAENLGMIPPNTAALVIYDGKKRYETLLTSDLSKSATIRLRRKQ
jgi:hypothetical protein